MAEPVARLWVMKLDGVSWVQCDPKDPEAKLFRVSSIGNEYNDAEFKTLDQAEAEIRRLCRVFKAGKKQAKLELNTWLQGGDF